LIFINYSVTISVFSLPSLRLVLGRMHSTSVCRRTLTWLSDHCLKVFFAVRRMLSVKVLRLITLNREDSIVS
jgi:hypothetical protein